MHIGNILKSFSDIIAHLEVLRFEVEGNDSALQLSAYFLISSLIFVLTLSLKRNPLQKLLNGRQVFL